MARRGFSCYPVPPVLGRFNDQVTNIIWVCLNKGHTDTPKLQEEWENKDKLLGSGGI